MNIVEVIKELHVKKANKRQGSTIERRANTLLTDATDFATKEAYKTARTNIRFSLSSGRGCKKVIVTSASPGEGKTTTCLNLAIAFAQTEARVLIIDADLRKPRINRHLSIPRENGLSDLLCGMIDTETAIKRCERHNLDCITAGQIPPNPVELLSSKEMEFLLEELGGKYDYIFIDTPPVTMVTEAAAMAKNVDGVIVVVRQNHTIAESVERARNNLSMANAKILGYVLNGVDGQSYGYGAYGSRTVKRYGGYGDSSTDGNRNTNMYSYQYGYKDKRRMEKGESQYEAKEKAREEAKKAKKESKDNK